MARDFVNAGGAVTDYLEKSVAVTTGYPASLACWFYPNDVATSQDMVVIGTTSANTNFRLNFGGATAGDPVRGVATNAGTAGVSVSSAGANGVANTWYHACATFTDATNRAAYFNGANKGTNATSITSPTGMDTTDIACGMFSGTARSNGFDGALAECAVWNVALSDADAAILALGVSPLLVRPDALVAYWPLLGESITSDEIDKRGGNTLTQVSSPLLQAHPRVIYPRRRFSYDFAVAAGGVVVNPFSGRGGGAAIPVYMQRAA